MDVIFCYNKMMKVKIISVGKLKEKIVMDAQLDAKSGSRKI